MPTSDWAPIATWADGQALQEPGIVMELRNVDGETFFMAWHSVIPDDILDPMPNEWRAVADPVTEARCDPLPLPLVPDSD